MPRKLDPDEYFIQWPHQLAEPALFEYLKANNKTFRLTRTYPEFKRYRIRVTGEELTFLKMAFGITVNGK